MKNHACGGAAFGAVTIATTLLMVLLLSSPATATPPTPPAPTPMTPLDTMPVKNGAETLVNTYVAGHHQEPVSVRRSDGKYVVVWHSDGQDGDRYGVYMQLFNSDRTKLGGEVRVSTSTASHQRDAHVSVAPDNSFVICWYSDHLGSHRVFSQAYNSDGDKVGSELQITTGISRFPDVAHLTNGDIVFCWYDDLPTRRISMRRYSSTLTPLDTEVEVHTFLTPTYDSEPRIAALTGGGFVIVFWVGTGTADIHFQLYNNAGATVGGPVLANTYSTNMQFRPAVAALPNGGFVLTWTSVGQDGDKTAVAAQLFSATGTTVGSEFIVNTQTTGSQEHPTVATFHDNSFLIAWSGSPNNSFEVYVQYFGADGTKIGPETQVNTHSQQNQLLGAIAVNWVDKEFAVFYSSMDFPGGASYGAEIAGQWFTTSYVPPTPLPPTPAPTSASPIVRVGGETAISTYAETSGEGEAEAVRRADGKTVIVWMSSHQDGSSYGVFMQLYNADRTRLGGEVQVNTNAASLQIYPQLAAAPDNSFVVCWTSYHLGTAAIFAQAYSSSGATVGSELQVSTTMGGALSASDVAYLANGDIVFCWADGFGAVFTRLFSPAFTPRASEVQMHTIAAQTALHAPRIAALTGGGFVIVYHAENTAGDTDVYFQLHTSAGAAIGDPTQANVFATSIQQKPHVAALPDGGFIVTWQSALQDGDGDGIVASHFSHSGTRIGTEFVVHSHTADSHEEPKVTTFHNNSFAIVWFADELGDRDDSSRRDVFFQYFDANHDKVGPPVLANTRTAFDQYMVTIASNWVDNDFAVFYASGNHIGELTDLDIVGQWFSLGASPPTAPAPATPAPPPAGATPCTSACLQYRCTAGALIDIIVTGVVTNDVYGTMHFSDDSNVASAAVFAGVVANGETKTITVKCSGEQPSFPSGSANGVTTQAFPSPWEAFTFELGGETQAPPPPAPERCFTEGCAHNKCHVTGTSFTVLVEGVVSNNVWGSSPFSDDSWVGSAAVHQGLLQAGSIGSVTVWCVGRRESLTGSTQNGVTSISTGAWNFNYILSEGPAAPPLPPIDSCSGACLQSNCPAGEELFLRVHGTTYGYLWGGNAPYTEDTTVAAAAVHAGLIAPGEVGIVKATCNGPQSSFTGSTQNGVTTQSFAGSAAAFTLSAGGAMPTVSCAAGGQCLNNECSVAGRLIKVSVTGSTNPTVEFWGTARYSSDSPVSHAAVHDGLVADGETKVLYVSCLGPFDDFTASTANGVTSSTWNTTWPGSFTLSATP